MDLSKVAFEAVSGLPIIYSVGFIPNKSSFVELTPEQLSFYYSQGGDISRKVYAIVPNADMPQMDVPVVSECQIPSILKAGALLRSYGKTNGRSFHSDAELLDFVLAKMPEARAVAWAKPRVKTAG
ncbi:MAG: hypothetical protein LBC69_00135 [Eubacteriaceae bacterium]|nr:hypothetical protein [Eubacteriaceae bacterium]